MDRCGDRDLVAPGLHELQQAGLAEHVLEHDPIGTQHQIALARLHFLMLGIVEMAQQDLVRQGQRLTEPASHDGEVARHRLVDLSRHFRVDSIDTIV